MRVLATQQTRIERTTEEVQSQYYSPAPPNTELELKREQPIVKDIQRWDARSEEMLQDCSGNRHVQNVFGLFFFYRYDTDERTETITE